MVADYLKSDTTKVAEGTDGDEYLIKRLDHVIPAINIVKIYGDQESRVGKESILSSWLRLKRDLTEIENRGEAAMIIGDI